MSRLPWLLSAALPLALLASTAAARGPHALKLRFPRLVIPAGTNPEACLLVRVATTTPFDVASIEIRHRGVRGSFAVQHFLVHLYTGEQLGAFEAARGRVVPSRGCLDLGPADRDRRQLVASGTLRRSRSTFPPGVALRLSPVPDTPGGPPAGLGFTLDGEWVNGTARTRSASVLVVLRRARPKKVTRIALPFADRSAEAGLLVAPGAIASTEALAAGRQAAWGPGRPGGPGTGACVLQVTGQMHKRGRFFGVDLIGADGTVENPAGGAPNPFEPGRSHLFGALDWTDEGALVRLHPIPLDMGQALHYACWDDNGAMRAPRLGCEEVSGVPPGQVGAPAKPCTDGTECTPADPAYPGRTFTGACRPANLVAGPTPEDEVCRLDGIYVPADPVAGCPP
jgi:hypothetical protein